MHRTAIALAVAFLWPLTIARAQSIPLDSELEAAVATFKETVAEAGADFLPRFDKAIEDVRKNKALSAENRLAVIENLKEQLAAFERDGDLPEGPAFSRAAVTYQRVVEAATAKLDVAFNKAIRQHTKEGKDKEAAELSKFRNQLVVGPGYELIGRWKLVDEKDRAGFFQQLHIQKKPGQWLVDREFRNAAGKPAGMSTGKPVRFVNDTIQYTEHYVRKPRSDYESGAVITITRTNKDAEQLTLEWKFPDGGGGRHILVRAD